MRSPTGFDAARRWIDLGRGARARPMCLFAPAHVAPSDRSRVFSRARKTAWRRIATFLAASGVYVLSQRREGRHALDGLFGRRLVLGRACCSCGPLRGRAGVFGIELARAVP